MLLTIILDSGINRLEMKEDTFRSLLQGPYLQKINIVEYFNQHCLSVHIKDKQEVQLQWNHTFILKIQQILESRELKNHCHL